MKNITITSHPLLISLIIIGILIGVFITIFVTNIVYGEDNVIQACVRNNGSLRIISGTETCLSAETPLSWNIQGLSGPSGPPGSSNYGLPFICHACELQLHPDKFAGKDFSNAEIKGSSFGKIGVINNLAGVIFKGGILSESTFENVDLTGADLSDLVSFSEAIGESGGGDSPNNSFGGRSLSFQGSNLTSANFSNDALFESNFSDTVLNNTNFTNANIHTVNFNGATMMDTAILTGVVWNNTTCPDGTNSDNNGNTCVGHF